MTPNLVSMLTKGQTLVEVPLSDGSLVKVPQWKANGAPSLNAWVRQQVSGAAPSAPQGTGPLNAAKQIMQSQGKSVAGLYGGVVAQAARALGYNNADATNCHIRKWRSI
jgi:hypothetical protein